MNNKNIIISLFLVIAISSGIFLSGCTNQPGITPGNQNNITQENISQNITPSNITSDNTSLIQYNHSINNTPINAVKFNNIVDANNQFAKDLYSRYKLEDKNIFFSPYSISSALAMTYEGAKGRTAEEMQAVLHLPNDKEQIRNDFVSIYTEINKADKPYKLTTANALWAQTNFPFYEDYFNTVNTYYDGKVTNLNFKTDTENSRLTINGWVENKTNDRIKNLIPKNVLSVDTRLVLTNVIYFKANWSNKFSAEDTRDGLFTLNSGDTVIAKMMHQTGQYNYAETNNFQILEMNYAGNDLSMLIILPKEDKMNTVDAMFTPEKLIEWKTSLETKKVIVTMPKFTFESTYEMSEDLKAMGMPTAFMPFNADFTGMYNQTKTDGENLYISAVIHKTFIEVAENGTEAAAATAVIMTSATAMPPTEIPKVFNANHPFIFIIQQKATGNILFMGRLSDPTSK